MLRLSGWLPKFRYVVSLFFRFSTGIWVFGAGVELFAPKGHREDFAPSVLE
ncbi:MAG: hypothetical protein J7L38_03285 [Thermoproteales archaeon]|nr:hypothetical protein [Thermoproteales archaeon]